MVHNLIQAKLKAAKMMAQTGIDTSQAVTQTQKMTQEEKLAAAEKEAAAQAEEIYE